MLHGELVTLRAPRRSDLADLQPILRDDVDAVATMDDAPWVPRSREMSEARFDKRLADDPAGDQVWLTVQIHDDPEERAVGEAGLWGIDMHRRHAHVGIALGRAQRGGGLGPTYCGCSATTPSASEVYTACRSTRWPSTRR